MIHNDISIFFVGGIGSAILTCLYFSQRDSSGAARGGTNLWCVMPASSVRHFGTSKKTEFLWQNKSSFESHLCNICNFYVKYYFSNALTFNLILFTQL